MKKIWDRGVAKKTDSKTSQVVEDYTVGIDYLLDLELLPYDIMASMAHAKMLHKIKILNSQEEEHTAIEVYLTEHCGIVGKKVHTGRSRNDQALVTVRLFSKEKLLEIKKQVEDLIKALEGQIKKQGKIKK